jgi:Bifunctional DNA primase/polymerase, N-terminal
MSNAVKELISRLAEGQFSTLQIALAYARMGIPVFPLKANEKKPAIANGFRAATTDPTVIKRWFNSGSNYNVGIVPGPAGWFVVDVDVGKNGFDAVVTGREPRCAGPMALPRASSASFEPRLASQ